MKKIRRWGPFKQQWYSICSLHREGKDDCGLCQTGSWYNIYLTKLSQNIYKKYPKLWLWWANL